MTGRLTAILLAAALLAALAVSIWTADARTERYGGVTPKERARMIRYIHLWFDQHNIGFTMTCIADRESGLNKYAFNNDDYPGQAVAGLLQIAWPIHARRGESWSHFYVRMCDPVQNIKLAYRLYRTSGLAPWGGSC